MCFTLFGFCPMDMFMVDPLEPDEPSGKEHSASTQTVSSKMLAVFESTPEREAPRDETGFEPLRGRVPERRRRTVFRARISLDFAADTETPSSSATWLVEYCRACCSSIASRNMRGLGMQTATVGLLVFDESPRERGI